MRRSLSASSPRRDACSACGGVVRGEPAQAFPISRDAGQLSARGGRRVSFRSVRRPQRTRSPGGPTDGLHGASRRGRIATRRMPSYTYRCQHNPVCPASQDLSQRLWCSHHCRAAAANTRNTRTQPEACRYADIADALAGGRPRTYGTVPYWYPRHLWNLLICLLLLRVREQTAKTGAEIGLSPAARHCRASHSWCQRVVDLRLGEVGPPLSPGGGAASVQHFRRIRVVVFPNDFVVALPTTAAREVRMMERAERRSLAFRSWRLARTVG